MGIKKVKKDEYDAYLYPERTTGGPELPRRKKRAACRSLVARRSSFVVRDMGHVEHAGDEGMHPPHRLSIVGHVLRYK